jgi:hypothetical protein
LITAATGLIAKKFGPGGGGLFLAFPPIFPASATLIEKHEKQNKERAGRHGSARGRKAAAVDAAGAAIGSLWIVSFAWLVQRLLPSHSAWQVLLGSTGIWLAVSLLLWQMRKRM